MKFYKCLECGSIVAKLNDDGCAPSCCGVPMKEIIAGSTDGAKEKHVPVIKEDEGRVYVQVGEIAHPMDPDHWIEWIYLLTDKGFQIKHLRPGEDPRAVFAILDSEVVLAVMAYCNKHGLFQASLD